MDGRRRHAVPVPPERATTLRPPIDARRVAVIADVHGNAPALSAVLTDIRESEVDLVVSCGDLTWGSFPGETLALMRELAEEVMCLFVRGNAERALLEMRSEPNDEARSDRERWMLANHVSRTWRSSAGSNEPSSSTSTCGVR